MGILAIDVLVASIAVILSGIEMHSERKVIFSYCQF